MTIVRTHHNRFNPFVQINKEALWDKDLSLAAAGLWARLLSRPDDWIVSAKELCRSCNTGKNKIYKLFDELIKAGYAFRRQTRTKSKTNKKMVYGSFETHVFEFKMTQEQIKKMFELTDFEVPHFELPQKGDTTNIPSSKEEVPLPKKTEKEKKESSKAAPSADAEALCDFFLSKIKERRSQFKEPNREKWLKEFDCLLRIDKRDLMETKALILWASGHSWWKTACISPSKLRKDFDEMALQMQGDEEKEIVRTNRLFAIGMKEANPKQMKCMTFDAKYAIHNAMGKEVPFNLPSETFREALISMFGGQYVRE